MPSVLSSKACPLLVELLSSVRTPEKSAPLKLHFVFIPPLISKINNDSPGVGAAPPEQHSQQNTLGCSLTRIY